MHLRTEIKAALKSFLSTPDADGNYPTLAKDRVFVNEKLPISGDSDQPKHMPCIGIWYTEEEISAPGDLDWTENRRTGKVTFELVADGHAADTKIDTMANQVETVFKGNDYLGDLVERFWPTSGKFAYDDNSASTIMVWTMDWTVTYIEPDTADVSSLDDFKLADAKYRSGSDIFEDQIDVPSS